MKGLLARKLGMTQLFNADGTTSAVTVLEAGPCRVLGLRTTEKDGYAAARIAFEAAPERKLTKPEQGVFKGLKMSGQMGNVRTTARAYRVVRVDPERNLILVRGGVPGAKGALVLVRTSTKPVKVKGPSGKPTGRKV